MTLILGMSKPEGIYLSVDYRVTNSQTGEKLDDASVKFLTIHYPPEKEGVKALFTYTGLAQLPDGTPVGDWLRQTLRGQTEVPDVSMHHLHQRLNRDLAGYRVALIVNVLAVQGDRRFAGCFTNVKSDGSIAPRFEYVMQEPTEPCVFVNGSGTARVVADGHLDLLRKQLAVRPRHPHNHMKLLATVNRRVAKVASDVSPRVLAESVNVSA